MRKRFFGILLSLAMIMSGFVPVTADETERLLSKNKPIEWGINGTGSEHSDVSLHGSVEVMVDGVKGGDNNGSSPNKQKMWYGRSTVATDTIYLNVDLEDAYMITKIGWRTRYTSANEISADYQGMVIYGANEADYSDMQKIFTVTSDYSAQDSEFVINEEDIASYRYIRFEKTKCMGGQELYIYGYVSPDSNANLSELSVDGYSFESEFSADTTEYTIISDGLPENNTVTVSAVTEVDTASVEGAGEITVDRYGTTVIPVTVTSGNGKIKTYNINFVAIEAIDISSQVTAHGSEVIYSGTSANDLVLNDSYCTNLFTDSVSRFRVYIKYNDLGYIQADLKKAYKLTKFEYTKSNLEAGKELVITASNDPEFADKVTIGNIAALSKTETTASCLLDSSQSYRYIRVEKSANAHDFLPLSMRIYATKDPLAVDSMTSGGIDTDTDVEIAFNDFLDESMDTSTVTVTRNGVVVEAEVAVQGDKFVISPASAWQAGAVYKVTIPAGTVIGSDGRSMSEEIVRYFAVSTDTLEISEFNIEEDELTIKAKNKLNRSLNITLWNAELGGECVTGAISETTSTVASGLTYEKIVKLSENCAVYFFEDTANMKMYLSPFVRTSQANTGTYTESENNLTAEYVDGALNVSGKNTSEEVSVFVTDSDSITKDSVKVIAAVAVENGTYSINISLSEDFESGSYNVWASDGKMDAPDKAAEPTYVLSSDDKQEIADQIADMSTEELKGFFEYDESDSEDIDNSKILSGIGIISDRPKDTKSLYEAIVNTDLRGTYSDIVADINEQIAIAVTKEKGIAYAIESYSSILSINETDENYVYVKKNSLIDEANKLMQKDYTDVESFNTRLSESFKLSIFKNTPSVEAAKTFAEKNNDFFGFNFTGDYKNLSGLQQQEVIKAAMAGSTAEEMRTLFDNAVKKYKNSGSSSSTSSGGGGGGGTGTVTTKPNADLPLPEVTVEQETSTGFSDINDSHWAYNSVMSLAEKGIVNGTDGKFMPENDVTREEFVKLLVLAANIKAEGEISFEDVPSGSWYYEYVAVAKNSGIVKGISDSLFGTGAKITRQDMAVMIYNACKAAGITFEEITDELAFDDSENVSEYAADAVKQLCAVEVIKGRDNNMFAPAGNATRAEAAEIICRMLNLIS